MMQVSLISLQPKVGDWAISRKRLPVFSNIDCSLPGFIHARDCRAACSQDGFPSGRRCICSAAVSSVRSWTPFQIQIFGEAGVLVTRPGSGPFWIEQGRMEKAKNPEPEALSLYAAPPDFLVIELALAMGPIRANRRKRDPGCTEIVFVREDLRHKESATPWRLLCEVTRPEGKCVLLIDPSLPAEKVFMSGWAQQRLIPLRMDGEVVERARILVPAFPIGDVTDPGWS